MFWGVRDVYVGVGGELVGVLGRGTTWGRGGRNRYQGCAAR